ncbi:MAG: hypothetical protein JNM63_02155, partial [Spirochaetia bacterium]|nr:hypothetical protein [Spirochaetia bacterium]
QDVRLRELLNSANKSGDEASRLDDQIKSFQNDRDNRILRVREDAKRDLALLNEDGISSAEKAKRRQEILAREQAEVAKANEDYRRKAGDLETRVRELQASKGAQNTGLIELAKKNEAVLSASDMLTSIRLKQQKAAYEEKIVLINRAHAQEIDNLILKYNPIYRPSDRALKVINAPVSALEAIPLRSFDNLLAVEGVLSQSAFAKIRQENSNQVILMNRMLQIPFTNSVARTIQRLDDINQAITVNYEKLWDFLIAALKRKNQFEYAVHTLAKEKTDHGFILDPRDSEKVGIYLDPIYLPDSGMTGLVYRLDDELVGKVQFYQVDGKLWAKVTQTTEGKKLKPFDRIYVVRN